MKVLLSILAACLLTASCGLAEVPDPLWTRSVGTDDYEAAFALCLLETGDILVGGRMSIEGQRIHSPMILRMTLAGDSVWTITAPPPLPWDTTTVFGLCALPDGGFTAAGSNGLYSGAPFLTRYTAASDTQWNVHYDDWNNVQVTSAARLADGGYVMAGHITTQWNLPPRLFAARLGTGGGMRWTRAYPADSSAWGHANAVIAMPDSGCVIAGCLGTSMGDTTTANGYVMRLSTRLDTLWTRTYGTGQRSEFRSVDRTPDGGFILAGFSKAAGREDNDIWVVRIDAMGTMLWQQQFGANQDDIANSVKAADGGYVIAGRSYIDAARDYDGYLMWLNPGGEVAWSGTVGGNGFDDFSQLVLAPDDGFVVSGTTYSTNLGTPNMYVLRFPSGSGWVGTVRDRVTHAGLPNVAVSVAGLSRVAYTDAHGFYQLYVTPGTYDVITYGPCTTRDTVHSDTVIQSVVDTLDWMVDRPRVSIPQSSLNLVVQNHISGSAPLFIRNDGPGLLDYSLVTTTNSPRGTWLSAQPSSGTISAGDSVIVWVSVHADTTDNSVFDYYGGITVHVNACPDTVQWILVLATALDADDDLGSVVRTFSLSAYPNPFNPSTTLNFTLPRREMVSLALFDITGRQVKVLRQGMMEAGSYQQSLDGSGLASGIYFARLQTPTYNQTRKLMLLK